MLKRALGFVSVLAILVVILFVINETAQVVNLAAAVHPSAGPVVLALLLAIYAVCLGVPAVLFLRLPTPLRPPPTDTGPEFARHLAQLRDRLARNPHLAAEQRILRERADIERALAALHARAREQVAATATAVFASTAVSQSGRLDGLMVLVAQTRMIWRVAHVYSQRPHLREVLQLYGNVAATVLAAQAVEDLDLSEVLEPVLAPVLANSALGGVPGFGGLATFVTNAILEGTVNAFLTLRVGCITSRYCSALTLPDRRQLRRSATAEAASQLGGIVMTSAAQVGAAIWEAARRSKTGQWPAAMGRIVLKPAEAMAAAAVDLADASGASQIAGALRKVVNHAAETASTVLSAAAKRAAAANPVRGKPTEGGGPTTPS